MRSILGLCLIVAAILIVASCCPQLASAATCNCSVTEACVCPAGQCQCPGCPANVSRFAQTHAARTELNQATFPVHVVPAYAAPVYVTPVIRNPAPAAVFVPVPVYQMPAVSARVVSGSSISGDSGCYRDVYGNWICPNSRSRSVGTRPPGVSGSDWRRMKRAVRDGWIVFE